VDKSTQAWNLYNILTDEIRSADAESYQVVTFGVGAIVALLAAGFKTAVEGRLPLFAASYVVIFYGMRLLGSNRRRIWRISTYARVFLEPELEKVQWQTHLAMHGEMSRERKSGLHSSRVFTNQLLMFGVASVVVAVLLSITVAQLVGWPAINKFVAQIVLAFPGVGMPIYAMYLDRKMRRGGDVETKFLSGWKDVRAARHISILNALLPSPADLRTALADAAPPGFVDRMTKVVDLLRTWETSPATSEELKAAHAVVAFSFGLTTIGSPGKSNMQLAEVVLVLLRENPALKVCTQWEVADALREHGFHGPLHKVVEPPRFQVEDICQPLVLRDKLFHAGPNTNERYVRDHLGTFGMTISDESLCEALNTILGDAGFHRDLPTSVELPQWEEEIREAPRQSDRLGKYQAVRVNRLILEAIFPNELRPAPYLSTWGVVRAIPNDLRDKSLVVVAHPDHAYRCGALLAAVLKRDPLYANCRGVGYDAESAQPWTRSRDAFLAYEVKARIDALAEFLLD
jgi:hypothetical protein